MLPPTGVLPLRFTEAFRSLSPARRTWHKCRRPVSASTVSWRTSSAKSDVVVDCTPKHVAERNVEGYRQRGLKFIAQGGEKHELTGHSFVAEANYASAVGLEATAWFHANTTLIVRTLSALKRAGLLRNARGTLLRRATDPWESHSGGIMNTLVPEADIPSHQGAGVMSASL
jgi:glyceraldehyde-3-phosphate dehydrogenase (NAD(P))